ELLARQQGKELPALPDIQSEASPEEQLTFVRALTERIHAVQNRNNACITPRLSREFNGMDCSMSTWVMQHELAKAGVAFEWGSPVGHAVGIVTLRNGDRYYADGQGGFVERVTVDELPLPEGGKVLEIGNWREIQERRPSFFPRYVFVMPNGDVQSTIGNMDSMLYKQHLGPISEAQRRMRSEEDVRIVEQLQPYARKLQDMLRPYATGERDQDGYEVSPLNQILESVFPASDAMYRRREFLADESRMSMRIEVARELLGERMVFGPEAVRAMFGIELRLENIPPIPYSREELERAKENGEVLVLRIDHDGEGRPLTLDRMEGILRERGGQVFARPDDVEDARQFDMEFFTKDIPRVGWVLVRVAEIPETRHLSIEGQQAFMRRDIAALEREVQRLPAIWDREGIPAEVRPSLPSIEDLRAAMARLPEDAELPNAADVVFDDLLRRTRGEVALTDMAVATSSRVQEMLADDGTPQPERPIDVGAPTPEGISFHYRRSMDFGRPLTNLAKVPGVPIGIIQH
ncbi:MAG: hypothetical protein Q7S02_00855, partial [bacterium]|nr:hypothetical protein [bacterium]